MKRIPLLLFPAALASLASAETYTVKLYGVPAGTGGMAVFGAGDGGMMTGTATVGGMNHAATFTPQGFRDLHPTGWTRSNIFNSWGGTYHVGSGVQAGSTEPHALFWVGGGPAVDLQPSQSIYLGSEALGVEGQYQCGRIYDGSYMSLACVWYRTPGSMTTLRSGGYTSARAVAMDVSQMQRAFDMKAVGWAFDPEGQTRALLWQQGAEAEPVALNPAGYEHSAALAIAGGMQGGYVYGTANGDHYHAAVWSSTAASFQNINPAAFLESRVVAMRAKVLVGYGKPVTTPGRNQAILWHRGYLHTWTNLHAKLPYPFQFWHSYATDVDAQGNIVGYVTSPDLATTRPVIWLRS